MIYPEWIQEFVLDANSLDSLAQGIHEETQRQRPRLEQLLKTVDLFDGEIHSMTPRDMTSIAIVGVEAGAHVLQFDPFMVQIVRVVDSLGHEHVREVVSQDIDISALSKRQFDDTGNPVTPMGFMMEMVGVTDLRDLSSAIPSKDADERRAGWVRDFRILCEWATTFETILSNKDIGKRLYVVDNLLRCKMFKKHYFTDAWKQVRDHIEDLEKTGQARIGIAGFMPNSHVVKQYQLAIELRGHFHTSYPCYARVPKQLEDDTYKWPEWSKTPGDDQPGDGERAKFSAGRLHFAKFGNRPRDPLVAIDVPWFQDGKQEVSDTMGFLLRESKLGFPDAWMPHCLQQARKFAKLQAIDYQILQDKIRTSVRAMLAPEEQDALEIFGLRGLVS